MSFDWDISVFNVLSVNVSNVIFDSDYASIHITGSELKTN